MVGCSAETVLTKESASQLLGGQVQGDFARKLQEAEAHWQKADQPGEIEAAIAAWEEAITIETPELDPETRRAKLYEVYVRLSRAYYLLGDTVVWLDLIDQPEERDAKIKDLLTRGRAHAERAMGVYSPAFLKAMQDGDSIGAAAEAHLDKGAVGAMFWWSALVARWLVVASKLKALNYLDDLEKVSHLAYRLDPSFWHYAPVGYLGAH